MPQVEAPSEKSKWDLISGINVRGLLISCWIVLIAVATVRAWFTRYEFDGDSISYMDIGRMIAEGHPEAVINAYWSPGYPVFLSFLWLFHPGVYWECPLVHLFNVLIFIGALTSFQLFWRETRHWHEQFTKESGAAVPECAFWGLGYSIFAVATLNVIRVGRVTPDMLVATFCLLAAWSALRFRRVPSIGRALMLGLILALGYYAKAPLFPIGFIFILCTCLTLPLSRQRLILGGAVLAVFLLCCAPLITTLSRQQHHLTFGESARLNQAFFVNGVEHYVHWQGEPPGSGIPIHPTRRVNDIPAVFEFSSPDMGTYPPWFDPVFWYEGVTPHTDWKLQSKIFIANLILEFQIITDQTAMLICAVMILAVLGSYRMRWVRNFLRLWHIWVPAIAALFMFALVHVESRFLGGWIVLLFAGSVWACSLPENGVRSRAVEGLGLIALVVTAASLLSQASQEALSLDHIADRSPRNAIIADYLLNHGLRPGAKIAVIGDGVAAYWAHLGRLKVVAEIPANIRHFQDHPALDFWASGPEQQRKWLNVLARTGAEAVIADPQGLVRETEPSRAPAGWQQVDGINTYVYFFQSAP